jgi:hypothetical protein
MNPRRAALRPGGVFSCAAAAPRPRPGGRNSQPDPGSTLGDKRTGGRPDGFRRGQGLTRNRDYRHTGETRPVHAKTART